MTATFYFLTLNLQLFHKLTPLATGIAFLPLSLGAFLAAAGSHHLQRRLGTEGTTAFGACVMSGGLTAIWLLSSAANPTALIVASGVFGVGMGIALASIADGTTRLLPVALAGVASGVLTTAQQFGNSFGLAVVAVADETAPSSNFGVGFVSAAILATLAFAVLLVHSFRTRRSPIT